MGCIVVLDVCVSPCMLVCCYALCDDDDDDQEDDEDALTLTALCRREPAPASCSWAAKSRGCRPAGPREGAVQEAGLCDERVLPGLEQGYFARLEEWKLSSGEKGNPRVWSGDYGGSGEWTFGGRGWGAVKVCPRSGRSRGWGSVPAVPRCERLGGRGRSRGGRTAPGARPGRRQPPS